MTASTHYAFSYLLLSAAGFEHSTAIASSFLSLLPDIDHPDSLIGRIFGPLSQYIQRRWGHRTVTHSIFAIFTIIIILLPLSLLYYFQLGKFPSYFPALSLAFTSHIFIDLFNRSGVRLFAPFSNKEYISFRTPELRILVNSWQEYVLLFVIVFLAFSVSNKPFSIHSAVRSLGKHFYKTYDSALKDYQDNASYVCNAEVTYFDEYLITKRTLNLPVISMNSAKAVFLYNSDRLLLRKENIDEILIHKKDTIITATQCKGSDIQKLPLNGYFIGSVFIYNYFPDIKSTDFVEVEKHTDHTVLKLFCACSSDISFIFNIYDLVNNEISLLNSKLCSFQIFKLREEESRINSKLKLLKSHFYDNYGAISKLSSNLKSIQNRIKTLELQQSVDHDEEIKNKIDQLKQVRVEYDITCLMM